MNLFIEKRADTNFSGVLDQEPFDKKWLKADDLTRDSARQKILLTMGEGETGNGGQGTRGRKQGKSGKRKIVVGL